MENNTKYWSEKNNYIEQRDYNTSQEIEKWNEATKNIESIDLQDYLNSFNEYKIETDKNKAMNLETLKKFRKDYTEKVNVENTTDNAMTKKEQIEKLEKYLENLKADEAEK